MNAFSKSSNVSYSVSFPLSGAICFPVSKSDYYFKTLESLSINYKIIDPSQNVVLNYAEYKDNERFNGIITNLLKLDLNKTSFQDAYIILTNTIHDLKQILENGAEE